ncbi:MAG: glycerophosphoryl diester phosphodiesterase membrane domain-containing protein [Microbacteriaceae bacterium]|nr:glycerophosphoryl diester phosphodiesterase membrane domain-containing protein [Microbacteriaceae bacterium]
MASRARRPAAAIPIGATAALGYRLTFRGLGRWLVLTAAVQGAVAVVAAPLLLGLFQTVLGAAGIASLTTATAAELVAQPGALALLIVFLLVSVAALVVQSVVIAVAADAQQSDAEGRMPGARPVLLGVARRLHALARPSTLLLLPYLLLLAPLGHAALGSVLTRWIAVPGFISGELTKSAAGTAAWVAITIVLWYLNLRLVLTVPFLAVGGRTAPQAFRASWAATRWRSWRVVAILLAVIVPAVVALVVLGALAVGVTLVSDAVNTDASPVVAAIAFAVAEIGAFFVVGIAVVVQTQAFVRIVRLARAAWSGEPAAAALRLAPLAQRTSGDPGTGPLSEERSDESKGRPAAWATAAVAVGSLAAVVALAFAAVPTLDRYADGATLVIAHRGDTEQAVENTIPALEAAAAAGADVVEFDVQQTKDGDWVVMHDFDLLRLTGEPGAVKDMTLAEATALTVRADGHEARVPSMREWVHRAKELGMPLLIEIKPHGQETADYLETFYAILDAEGVTDESLYHSLSAEVVAGQTTMRPETAVGYIVPIALGGGAPGTPADFVVVEAFSYSDALRTALHDQGKGLLVWTVNDPAAMREYLRDGVDGIVTDHVPMLLAEQDAVADETGLAPKLLDALNRSITLW